MTDVTDNYYRVERKLILSLPVTRTCSSEVPFTRQVCPVRTRTQRNVTQHPFD
jgi:hypothetical protein